MSGLGLFGGSVSGAAAEFEAADVLPKRLRGVAQVRAGGVVCSNIAAFFWGVMSSSLTVLLGCDRPVDCSRAFPTRPSTSAAFFAVSKSEAVSWSSATAVSSAAAAWRSVRWLSSSDAWVM